jgi:hypothetical protein
MQVLNISTVKALYCYYQDNEKNKICQVIKIHQTVSFTNLINPKRDEGPCISTQRIDKMSCCLKMYNNKFAKQWFPFLVCSKVRVWHLY